MKLKMILEFNYPDSLENLNGAGVDQLSALLKSKELEIYSKDEGDWICDVKICEAVMTAVIINDQNEAPAKNDRKGW